MSTTHGTWSSKEFMSEVRSAALPQAPGAAALVTDADIASLPATARQYLRFMGIVGRPRDWSFRMASTGWFRMRPEDPWMACDAWQYNTRPEIARIFVMTMPLGGLVPMLARDTYIRGHGRMRGRVMKLLPVADARGPELDTGELVTWLNDAVLIAPSMLLGPGTTWSAVDRESFDVALTDRGRTVTARVTVDERGAPVEFGTTDRLRYDPTHTGARWVRNRWTTPVTGWRLHRDRPLFTLGRAVWHIPRGPFIYAELRPRAETLEYNVPPTD